MIERFQNFENTENNIEKVEVIQGATPEDIDEPLWVDFDYGADEEKDIKGAELNSYVISPVTEQNLFSDKFINCTATIGIGTDKESGKPIAFISHQDPDYFLHKSQEETDKFVNDLKDALSELLQRSKDGSVEIGLLGGNKDTEDTESKKNTDYAKSIDLLRDVIESHTGISARVMLEPNQNEGAVDITVVTKDRKVFVE